MALPDLTGQNIQDTYKRVLTVGDDGLMYDGTGSLYTPVSASYEINTETSSSHAETADSASYILSSNIEQPFTHITASGDISASGDLEIRNITASGTISASNIYVNASTLYIGGTSINKTLVDNIKRGFASDADSDADGGYGEETARIENINTETLTCLQVRASGNISSSGDLVTNNITASGHIVPIADNAVDLGTTVSKDFRTLYVRNIDIHNQRFKMGYTGTTATLADHSSVGDGFLFTHLNQEILRLGNDGDYTANFSANITASGDISASGDLEIRNITASGNISASGTLIAQDVIAGGVFEANLKTQNIGDNLTGTIVVWEEDKLIPCDKSEDELVMGVIRQGRDEPIVLGAEPVLVTGKVNIGDYIVTSDKQGHGKSVNVGYIFKKNLFGKVIGQALESSKGKNSLIKCMIRKM